MCCHVLRKEGSPAIITPRQCVGIDANACRILHGRLIKLYMQCYSLSSQKWRILPIDQHASEDELISEGRCMALRAFEGLYCG
jgi:hypothetical protein